MNLDKSWDVYNLISFDSLSRNLTKTTPSTVPCITALNANPFVQIALMSEILFWNFMLASHCSFENISGVSGVNVCKSFKEFFKGFCHLPFYKT